MYWLAALSVLAVVPLGLGVLVTPRWDDMRVKHRWDAIPNKWECQGHPPAGTTIDLRIALRPHHENALVDALYEVSDPSHPKYVSILSIVFLRALAQISLPHRYGAHLSKEEVAELVTPHPDTLELVSSWLTHHGVPPSSASTTHGGNWLTLTAVPLDQANTLLNASYQLYRHTETDETVLRTIGYALPAALLEHVQTVAPTTYFGSPRALRQTLRLNPDGPTLPNGDQDLPGPLKNVGPTGVPGMCSTMITPKCLRALYNTSTYVPVAAGRNQLGIAGYLDEFASQLDLTQFMLRFRLDAAPAIFTVQQVNGGGNDQSEPGTEVRVGRVLRVHRW